MEHRIYLIRHAESQWNKEERLTGWTDIGLSDRGVKEAEELGRRLKSDNIIFDKGYISFLKRTEETLSIALRVMEHPPLEIERSWHLNENHYGIIQGMKRSEVFKLYGNEMADLILNSYNTIPPQMEISSPASPHNDPLYSDIDPKLLPLGESYKMLEDRVYTYWRKVILEEIKREGYRNTVVLSHGHAIRSIIKNIEDISDVEIMRRLPATATPYIVTMKLS